MPMKAFRFFIFIIVVAFLGWGIIRLSGERRSVSKEVFELKDASENVKKENAVIADKIECLKNPENLVKELKSQMNVVKSGEKLIIVVPPPEVSKDSGFGTTLPEGQE